MAFRYVTKKGIGWKKGFIPDFPDTKQIGKTKVGTADQVLESLKRIICTEITDDQPGILLSGGIDSAILAALLPDNTITYTIKFLAPNAIDESATAAVYAKELGLKHKKLEVTWKDYLDNLEFLLRNKKSPLHAVELGLYLAAKQANQDGVQGLIVGNGADSTFGGMDKLLSKDWSFDEFIKRYTFIMPETVVKDPVSIRDVYEPYRRGELIDVQRFLKKTHGLGIVQSFEAAISAGGCKTLAPFEFLSLNAPLDIARIRNGESKYLLRSVFHKLFPNLDLPEKIPFARPMHEWMDSWQGPSRDEFRDDLKMYDFSGEQKWILFCLERFLNLIESN